VDGVFLPLATSAKRPFLDISAIAFAVRFVEIRLKTYELRANQDPRDRDL